MKGNSLKKIAYLLGQNLDDERVIKGFAIDSREIQSGEVFFALKGEKVDGHTYLNDVANKKAAAAVVSKNYQYKHEDLPLIFVDNVLESLHFLAKHFLLQQGAKVVAVTGSVGKSTTKEFIASLLQAKFRVAKTPGNYNTQISFPLSILNSEDSPDIFVLEMGMSSAGQIKKLVHIAPPDIAVVTKVALAHAAFFPEGLNGIASAKAEIFSSSKTKLGIVNAESWHFEALRMSGSFEKQTFSLWGHSADFTLHRLKEDVVIDEKGQRSPSFSLPFQETHFLENFLAAAAVSRNLGLTWDEIVEAARFLSPLKLRFEKIEKNGVLFVNDCYNANPASMRAALFNLPKVHGKRIAVLGSMKELGAFSNQCHIELAEYALDHVDHLLALGDECMPMVDLFLKRGRLVDFFSAFEELKEHLFQLARPGDLVLIKGSKSHGLWRLLENAPN